MLFSWQQHFTRRSDKQQHVTYHVTVIDVPPGAIRGRCGIISTLHPAPGSSCFTSLVAVGGHIEEQNRSESRRKHERETSWEVGLSLTYVMLSHALQHACITINQGLMQLCCQFCNMWSKYRELDFKAHGARVS